MSTRSCLSPVTCQQTAALTDHILRELQVLLALAGDVHNKVLPEPEARRVLLGLDGMLRLSLWTQKETFSEEHAAVGGRYERVLQRYMMAEDTFRWQRRPSARV